MIRWKEQRRLLTTVARPGLLTAAEFGCPRVNVVAPSRGSSVPREEWVKRVEKSHRVGDAGVGNG